MVADSTFRWVPLFLILHMKKTQNYSASSMLKVLADLSAHPKIVRMTYDLFVCTSQKFVYLKNGFSISVKSGGKELPKFVKRDG